MNRYHIAQRINDTMQIVTHHADNDHTMHVEQPEGGPPDDDDQQRRAYAHRRELERLLPQYDWTVHYGLHHPPSTLTDRATGQSWRWTGAESDNWPRDVQRHYMAATALTRGTGEASEHMLAFLFGDNWRDVIVDHVPGYRPELDDPILHS